MYPYLLGTKSTANEIKDFMTYVFATNEKAIKSGGTRTPICIWGTHGIGKTALVRDYARKQGYRWASIAPAQFEEMGDLLGMPSISGGQTTFSPPDWVPREEGPGILLIDDVNRADDRILRGIMQLLQDAALVSWQLPKGWQIVLTANPDNGDYSVTPMDHAMLTRMMHISMIYDRDSWMFWAEQNHIDTRCISFMTLHPKLEFGARTTPRSLVQFFRSLENIKDFSESIGLVQMLAHACLDEAAVMDFIFFIQNKLDEIITPEAILHAKDFQKEVYEPLSRIIKKETGDSSLLSNLCDRLKIHLLSKTTQADQQAIKNIQAFIKMDLLPNDQRLLTLRALINSKNTALKTIANDPAIASLLLEGM